MEQLENKGKRWLPNRIWLVLIGQATWGETNWWQRNPRRYAVDRWYRFAKRRLHWILPRFSTPEQGERWSDLMHLSAWDLWLARPSGLDKPLPWQKKQTELTPGQVGQGIGELISP